MSGRDSSDITVITEDDNNDDNVRVLSFDDENDVTQSDNDDNDNDDEVYYSDDNDDNDNKDDDDKDNDNDDVDINDDDDDDDDDDVIEPNKGHSTRTWKAFDPVVPFSHKGTTLDYVVSISGLRYEGKGRGGPWNDIIRPLEYCWVKEPTYDLYVGRVVHHLARTQKPSHDSTYFDVVNSMEKFYTVVEVDKEVAVVLSSHVSPILDQKEGERRYLLDHKRHIKVYMCYIGIILYYVIILLVYNY